MPQSAVEYDEVMKVLRECELKLRVLQQEGRLTVEGLREFVDLSTKVRAELDRRRLPDRRRTIRSSPERRSVAGLTPPAIEPA